MQEAKDSSEIENIINPQDDLYKHTLRSDLSNLETKEVRALHVRYQVVKEQGLLKLNTIAILISYDIANPKRLGKIYRVSKKNGNTGAVFGVSGDRYEVQGGVVISAG